MASLCPLFVSPLPPTTCSLSPENGVSKAENVVFTLIVLSQSAKSLRSFCQEVIKLYFTEKLHPHEILHTRRPHKTCKRILFPRLRTKQQAFHFSLPFPPLATKHSCRSLGSQGSWLTNQRSTLFLPAPHFFISFGRLGSESQREEGAGLSGTAGKPRR